MRGWACLCFALAVLMPWIEVGDLSFFCWQGLLGFLVGDRSLEATVYTAVTLLLLAGLFTVAMSVRSYRYDKLKWAGFLCGILAFALPILVLKEYNILTASLGQPIAAIAAILSLTPSE